MNTLHILLHSGLGDHIICNGIVRIYAEKYDKIVLNTTQATIDNVRYMYRDVSNIDFFELYYTDVGSYVEKNPGNNYLIVGCTPEYFKNLYRHTYRSFDYGFYLTANIPYENRWNKFFFIRDFEKEKGIYHNKLNLKDGEDFVFIHEDPLRERLLDRRRIPSDVKHVNTNDFKDVGVFDLGYTIKRAKEVHVMDSCFLALIDNMQINHSKLFLHNYGKNRVSFQTGVLLNWKIYN